VAIHEVPSRSDAELRALLQVLVASDGVCADALLRMELLDSGFTRPDATNEVVLHLTPEGRRFLYGPSSDPSQTSDADVT
jgi:hypothetical protein